LAIETKEFTGGILIGYMREIATSPTKRVDLSQAKTRKGGYLTNPACPASCTSEYLPMEEARECLKKRFLLSVMEWRPPGLYLPHINRCGGFRGDLEKKGEKKEEKMKC